MKFSRNSQTNKIDWETELPRFFSAKAQGVTFNVTLADKDEADAAIRRKVDALHFEHGHGYPLAWQAFFDRAKVQGSEEHGLVAVSQAGVLVMINHPEARGGRS
jgi:hypothetical protein